ncbi:uncharacterized protein SPSK_10161 [Sporothrix schenckii 1099-18]|uniref:Uncharacterized protein n=1 Tax=Sporothrix schenckii 1099-18 TaxID=1397361 RepID=A0A0F2M8K4_SPOSC|nr:uncharacterized protein SPSK_10161 [Sporothrix schenckii 1099-18]KJR85957.1 hypothetical protein SPSK_10161 [Sporothrix schenckii 1099-18]
MSRQKQTREAMKQTQGGASFPERLPAQEDGWVVTSQQRFAFVVVVVVVVVVAELSYRSFLIRISPGRSIVGGARLRLA